MSNFTKKDLICVAWGISMARRYPEINEFDFKKYVIPYSEWIEDKKEFMENRRLDLRCIQELLRRMYNNEQKLEDPDLVKLLIYTLGALDAEKHCYDICSLRWDLKIPELFDKNM